MSRFILADAVLIIAAIGLLAIACYRIDLFSDAMAQCQQRHSFDACHGALNR